MGLSSTSIFWSICNWECMDKLDMNLSLVLMVKDQTSTTHRMWTCCILCCNSATISFDKLKPLKSIVYDKFVSKSEYQNHVLYLEPSKDQSGKSSDPGGMSFWMTFVLDRISLKWIPFFPSCPSIHIYSAFCTAFTCSLWWACKYEIDITLVFWLNMFAELKD